MDPEKKIVETTLPTYTLPTYTRMDDVRMEIGRAINREGMFKDAETGAAKNLYDLIENP